MPRSSPIATPSLALALAVGGVIGACRTMPVALDVSAPQVIPAGVLGKIDPDGSTTLFLDGMDLEIEVRNHRSGRTRLGWELIPVPFPPFLLPIPTSVPEVAEKADAENGLPLLLFLKLVPRAEGFVFEPGEVTVTPDEAGALRMTAVTGPTDDSCMGVESATDAVPQVFDLPPHVVTCFVPRFPVRASPDLGFRLSLSGLSTQREPIAPVELRYLKFSGSTVE